MKGSEGIKGTKKVSAMLKEKRRVKGYYKSCSYNGYPLGKRKKDGRGEYFLISTRFGKKETV